MKPCLLKESLLEKLMIFLQVNIKYGQAVVSDVYNVKINNWNTGSTHVVCTRLYTCVSFKI